MRRHKKVTETEFAKKVGLSVSFFSRVIQGERNLGYDNAVKVARKLKTTKGIWRHDGWTIARVAAWEAYCEKFNGGGKHVENP